MDEGFEGGAGDLLARLLTLLTDLRVFFRGGAVSGGV